MQVAQGSAANLKPELVLETLSKFAQIELPEYITYERLDMYYLRDNKLVSLDEAGDIIE